MTTAFPTFRQLEEEAQKRFPFTVTIPEGVDFYASDDWCVAEIGREAYAPLGIGTMRCVLIPDRHWLRVSNHRYLFRSHHDATAFKLRWG